MGWGKEEYDAYYQANKDKIAARNRTPKRVAQMRANSRAHYLRNKEKVKRKAREWKKANRAAVNSHGSARRARKRLPSWADRKAIERVYLLCPPGHHVDHIVPLHNPEVCGLHVVANLQYLPEAENLAKGNIFDPEIYPNQGTLFTKS